MAKNPKFPNAPEIEAWPPPSNQKDVDGIWPPAPNQRRTGTDVDVWPPPPSFQKRASYAPEQWNNKLSVAPPYGASQASDYVPKPNQFAPVRARDHIFGRGSYDPATGRTVRVDDVGDTRNAQIPDAGGNTLRDGLTRGIPGGDAQDMNSGANATKRATRPGRW